MFLNHFCLFFTHRSAKGPSGMLYRSYSGKPREATPRSKHTITWLRSCNATRQTIRMTWRQLRRIYFFSATFLPLLFQIGGANKRNRYGSVAAACSGPSICVLPSRSKSPVFFFTAFRMKAVPMLCVVPVPRVRSLQLRHASGTSYDWVLGHSAIC